MSVTPGTVRADLDRAADRAAAELTSRRAEEARRDALWRAAPLLAAFPAVWLIAQFGAWNKDDPALSAWWILPVVVAACVAPFVRAWAVARSVRAGGVPRGGALGALDAELGLEGRLLAADEFSARPARTPFEAAALLDAADGARRAATAALRPPPEPDGEAEARRRRRATSWGALGGALLLLSLWVAGWDRTASEPASGDALVAEAGAPPALEADEPRDPAAADEPDEPPATEPPRDERERRAADARAAATPSPEVSDETKDSAGTTGAGRSSGALSSSAASQSKSAPSSQGQSSDPADERAKKPDPKKKPEAPAKKPEPREGAEEEQSGSTAGKGSSKGSNKSPTASDWQSRDQVSENDDQEIEDDEDTEDDEEEQENRGGVQPSLRDRRPPVSRDLQIGFGNRPNPDANGRGGPSEQKKSRGVASLVLGVPIPDRVKGRPGPGPTKITQERIEPEAEEAAPIEASARTPRAGPLEAGSEVALDPSLTSLLRTYFLNRRRTLSERP